MQVGYCDVPTDSIGRLWKLKDIERNSVTSFKILMWLSHRRRKKSCRIDGLRARIQSTSTYHSAYFLILEIAT
jgi:hypothetical protein